jgi:membrane associated rhomboid family serine protease
MIPLHDNIPTRIPPGMNYTVIFVTALVFLAQLTENPEKATLVEQFGMIPERVSNPDAEIKIPIAIEQRQGPAGIEMHTITKVAAPSPIPPILTMVTCILLHGGWMHFLGNMWFLHIFGDNVEDRFGHFGYLLFYAVCGIAASLVHYVTDPHSSLPTIGASGAIAGVMGAYFVWYPKALVKSLIPLGPVLQMVVIPAPFFLGIWFLMNLFQGSMAIEGTEAGGVAWWAHIGGFAAGALIAWLMGSTKLVSPTNGERMPEASHVGSYRVRQWPY